MASKSTCISFPFRAAHPYLVLYYNFIPPLMPTYNQLPAAYVEAISWPKGDQSANQAISHGVTTCPTAIKCPTNTTRTPAATLLKSRWKNTLNTTHLAGVSCNIPTSIRDPREGPQSTTRCSVDGELESGNNCATRNHVISVSEDDNPDIRDKHQWYVLEGVLMSAFNERNE